MHRSSILILALAALLIGPLGGLAEAAPPKPKKITLNAKAKTLTVGQKFTAKVKAVKPAKASKKVRWSSSKKKVATVTRKGVIKAVGAGTATITAQSAVRPRVKAKIKITVKAKKAAIVIDPKLVGTWGMFGSGTAMVHTFKADGTWTEVLILRTSFSTTEYFFEGNYQAKNGQIHFSNIRYQHREGESGPFSAWKPAADPNRVENYVIGTDEDGEYLSTEDHPDPVTEESLRYRRSE